MKNSVLMQGFIVCNYAAKLREAMGQWLPDGSVDYFEAIVGSFEQAYIGLLEGKDHREITKTAKVSTDFFNRNDRNVLREGRQGNK